MSAQTERRLPVVAAFLVAVMAGGLLGVMGDYPNPTLVAVAALTFGVVAAGFSATQRNILLGMGGSRVLSFMVKTGYHTNALNYLMDGVYAGVGVSACALAGLFLFNCTWWVLVGWTSLVAGAVAFVIGTIVRNEIMMARIIKHYMEDRGR